MRSQQVLGLVLVLLPACASEGDSSASERDDTGSTGGSGAVLEPPVATGGSSSGGFDGTGGDPFVTGGASVGGGPGSGGAPPSSGGVASNGGSGAGGDPHTGGSPSTGGSASGELIGWAADPACGPTGTTGGGEGEITVIVENAEEFEDAMLAEGPAVIEFRGTIAFVGRLSGVRDKTVLGTNDAELSGSISFDGARNVIFKNIMFKNPSDEAGIDTFELSGSECVWFDHCEFVDGTDGTLDIVRASDYVTVSWSKIYYTKGNNHMLACLCGNGNDATEDEGKINITFHHNYWGAGIRSRAPRVRFGKVHVFNNYYKFEDLPNGGGDNSKIVAGFNAKLVVENNYFEDTRTPMEYEESEPSEMVASGNVFVNCNSGETSRGASFVPPYEYSLDDGATVKDSVMNGAGRH